MTELAEGITSTPNVRGGEPCIEGTRIPPRAVSDFAKAGYGVTAIMAEYPSLKPVQIAAALAWEMRKVSDPVRKEPALLERRVAALERDSHPPIDLVSAIADMLATQASKLRAECRPKIADTTQDRALNLDGAIARLKKWCAGQHVPPGYGPAWPGVYFADVRGLLAALNGLTEALTPSADTKAAYIGEFSFNVVDRDEDGGEVYRRVYVPWDTTKEIMAAIRARADSASVNPDDAE